MSKRRVTFSDIGWDEYLYWQKTDRKVLNKINRFIEESRRDPFTGTGKPEALKDKLSGFWSRRITDEHRFVYLVLEDEIRVTACRFHYHKK